MTPLIITLFALLAFGVVIVYLRSEYMGLILVILSIVCGQLIRVTLGTDVRGGSAIIVSDVAILGVVVTWIIRKLTKDRAITPNQLSAPILTFILIALISYVQGIFIIERTGILEGKELVISLLYWVRFVEYAFLFFIAFDLIRREKDIRLFLKWILLTGILVSIGGFIQMVVMPDFTAYAVKYGWDPHYYRLLSTFFDPNFVGGYLGMLMSICVALLFYEKRFSVQLLLFFALLIMGVALVMTVSRSGLIAFILGLVVIGIVKSRLFLLVGIVFVLFSLLSSPRFLERITEGLSVDETGVKRIESWTKGFKLTAAYPVLGVGYNNIASVQDDLGLVDEFDVDNRGGFENSLLTILVGTGIVGLMAYLYMWWIFLKSAYDIYLSRTAPPLFRGLSLGILAGMVGIIGNSMFINSLLYPFILINVWIFAAMVMRIKKLLAIS